MPICYSINKEILAFFGELENESADYINSLIVSAFVSVNGLTVKKKCFLRKFLLYDDYNLCRLLTLINKSQNGFGIEELLAVFEYVVSPKDKEINGAIYTPAYIREYIVSSVLSRFDPSSWQNILYADLACGCGGFFYTLLNKIKENDSEVIIADIIKNCILGIDIKEYSVVRTKILLSLCALIYGETLTGKEFNIFCQNSLDNCFSKTQIVVSHGGIDVVFGNPPYVASSKISDDSKALLTKWEVSKTGKSDLYLPFFQLGIDNLTPCGVLGYITVNTFYRSLNGYAFRAYLSKRGYDCSIVDFGSEQLFRGCSTYTCICIIRKAKTGRVLYVETRSDNLNKLSQSDYETLPYNTLDDKKGWILKDRNTIDRIKKIESVGCPLGDMVVIRNGFATLRNDIFIIRPIQSSKQFFYFEKKGVPYKIEKAICRKVIKANIIRKEEDLSRMSEYIVFPYYIVNGKAMVIPEKEFARSFPCAFNYLSQNKEELSKRDKGKKRYPAWYAYGRSQALNLTGERLLFPHICDHPCFVYTADEDLLFYDGYAIFANNRKQLELVRRVLSSDVFWYYVSKTSKPYSGGYFSLEKRYIRHFGLPLFSDEQQKTLLEFNNQEKINEWLWSFYANCTD